MCTRRIKRSFLLCALNDEYIQITKNIPLPSSGNREIKMPQNTILEKKMAINFFDKKKLNIRKIIQLMLFLKQKTSTIKYFPQKLFSL